MAENENVPQSGQPAPQPAPAPTPAPAPAPQPAPAPEPAPAPQPAAAPATPAAGMMCPVCNAAVTGTESFCPNCGVPFTSAPAPAAAPTPACAPQPAPAPAPMPGYGTATVPGMPPEQPKKGFPKTVAMVLGIILGLVVVAGMGMAFCSKPDTGGSTAGSLTGLDGGSTSVQQQEPQQQTPGYVGTWRMTHVTVEAGTLSYEQCVEAGIIVVERFKINEDGTYDLNMPGFLNLMDEKLNEMPADADYQFIAELPAVVQEIYDCESCYFFMVSPSEGYLAVNTYDDEMLMFTLKK